MAVFKVEIYWAMTNCQKDRLFSQMRNGELDLEDILREHIGKELSASVLCKRWEGGGSHIGSPLSSTYLRQKHSWNMEMGTGIKMVKWGYGRRCDDGNGEENK